MMRTASQRSGDAGFVLPSVLAYIAVAMLILLVGAQALERARDASLALQSDRVLVNALDDLEAEVTYRYLVSAPVRYGVSMTQGPRDAMGLILGTPVEQSVNETAPQGADALWRADGGMIGFQRDTVRATIEYRDVAGLLSLNSGDPDLIAGLLQEFGVEKSKATGLAARLKDYTDEDTLRRPLGAERADYRMRQLPPPTNSPLRNLSEVTRVMGWEELDFVSDPDFLSNVTASLTGPVPKWAFSPASVLAMRDEASQAMVTNSDPLSIASANTVVPGARARFIIRASDTNTGRTRLRIVEIERKVAAAAAPWTRSLVFDRPLPETTRPVSLEGVETVGFLQDRTDE